MSMPFETFFELVIGHKPFRWQIQVAEALCQNKWHEALGTPPATGKTSIIPIWYYSLYKNICDNPVARHIPLRLWYVVDRKVIVDGAAENAENLQRKLNHSPDLIPIGKLVQDFFHCDHPLHFGKIRGGMDRNEKNKWLTTPNQPTIVTSTVDQYGSRLLFRGYGISPKVASIHAAMTAIDSLLVLDEAHLSQSLRSILNKVEDNAKNLGNIPQTRTIELTATGQSQDIFPIDDITQDPLLTQRLQAKRNISLVRASTNIVDALVSETLKKSHHNIIATICNTVMTARNVFNKLQKQKIPCILLIGRIRPHERNELYAAYTSRLIANRDRSQDQPLVVVSTQGIEVGADFDFDSIISQAAPLDCLIQRFGRLDRLGSVGTTEGVIVLDSKAKEDNIYGEVTKDTFEWLHQNFSCPFDIGNIPRNSAYFAKTNHIPLLSDALLNMLAHTHKSQPISLDRLLHGVKLRQDSDFQLIYRNEITEDLLVNRPKEVVKWLALGHKPKNAEILSLPVYSLYLDDCSDTITADMNEAKKNLEKLCVRYSDGAIIPMSEICSGDLVIVPTSYGQYDKFGWNPNGPAPVQDVSDFHSNIVRWHPNWTPGFNINEYRSSDGDIEFNNLLNSISSSNVLPHQVKNLPLLKKGYVRITPDGKGVYIYPAYESNNQDQQELNTHNANVGRNARCFAKAIGLHPDLSDILEKSGLLHDLGKADPRFQEKLYAPGEVRPTLLAKSKGYNFQTRQRYPKGWRHELQSLAIALENNLGNGLKDSELFYHIIAAHHGWFRSGVPMVVDDGFQPFIVNGLKSTQPYFDVYAKLSRQSFYRLNERYGYWGLAFLETILRLADWKN